MLLNNNDRFKNKYRIDTTRMRCWDYFDNGYYFVIVSDGGVTGEHNPMGKKTLGEIIRWFKGKCSFFIHRIPAEFQWQARFYDHVVRSEKSLNRIREYIKGNPFRWDYDRNNLTHLKTLCD